MLNFDNWGLTALALCVLFGILALTSAVLSGLGRRRAAVVVAFLCVTVWGLFVSSLAGLVWN